VTRSSITNNRLHSFYPGMLILARESSENLIASNHFLRDSEPWTPFQGVDNGRDDLFGLLSINGSNNSVIGNHFSAVLDGARVRPLGEAPNIIRVNAGTGNYLANNHVVAIDLPATSGDSAFDAQVEALLTTKAPGVLGVTSVVVASPSSHNTILDSGADADVVADRAVNAVRPTPGIGR